MPRGSWEALRYSVPRKAGTWPQDHCSEQSAVAEGWTSPEAKVLLGQCQGFSQAWNLARSWGEGGCWATEQDLPRKL